MHRGDGVRRYDNRSSRAGLVGIALLFSDDCVLAGSKATKSTARGIVFYSCERNHVQANRVQSSASDGFSVTFGEDHGLIGNSANKSKGADLAISSATGVMTVDNEFAP